MPKATIQSKTGAVITIEGSQSEISNILTVFEAGGFEEGKRKQKTTNKRGPKESNKKRLTVPDLVLELKDRGFFDKPKGLGEVAGALEQQGYLYPVTTLSGVLLGLLKKRLLSRKKTEGKWVYGK